MHVHTAVENIDWQLMHTILNLPIHWLRPSAVFGHFSLLSSLFLLVGPLLMRINERLSLDQMESEHK
jgi:hypothetical protein